MYVGPLTTLLASVSSIHHQDHGMDVFRTPYDGIFQGFIQAVVTHMEVAAVARVDVLSWIGAILVATVAIEAHVHIVFVVDKDGIVEQEASVD